MKAIFISYDQAYNEEIVDILEKYSQRGFTRWDDIQGRGSTTGEPHMGTHAWPALNQALLTIVEDDAVSDILSALREHSEAYPDLGLRAFVWNIEQAY